MSTVINGSSPSITFSDGTTQSTAANISSPYTANGVVYASSTSALATGSALVFDGTNLGIGTSSPLSKLTIQTQSTARLSVRTTEAVFGTVTGGSAWDSLNGSDAALAPFGLRGNGVYINDGTATTTFSGGNLGLGVTPSAWSTGKAFEAGYVGNAFFGVSTTQLSITQNAYFNSGWKYAANGYATRFQQNTGTFVWNTSANNSSGAGASITFTDAMTLFNSGALGIGTTNDGSLPSSGIWVTPSYDATNASGIAIGHASGSTSGVTYMGFVYNATKIGSITQSGTTAVLYNVTSDQRLKTNIVDAPNGNIDQIKIRSFDWKSDGTHNIYGVIAQELVEVAPYAVHQPANPDEMMAVDYSKLVPMMIKEIQSLKQRIATLESK
jgi:hypothetical protein